MFYCRRGCGRAERMCVRAPWGQGGGGAAAGGGARGLVPGPREKPRRFPAACQRRGSCSAKSYPGRAIERALRLQQPFPGSLSAQKRHIPDQLCTRVCPHVAEALETTATLHSISDKTGRLRQ
ncbi:Protein Fam86C2P-Like [Manis pentadactyla]|nr:Protein Fam86C2P-Like [Manis pentadactyla]